MQRRIVDMGLQKKKVYRKEGKYVSSDNKKNGRRFHDISYKEQ